VDDATLEKRAWINTYRGPTDMDDTALEKRAWGTLGWWGPTEMDEAALDSEKRSV